MIEAWREAGVPLEAVLHGIDEAFDKHDARAAKSTRRVRKVNGLAWAAQSVMQATERMKEAATGICTHAGGAARAALKPSVSPLTFDATRQTCAPRRSPHLRQRRWKDIAARLDELAISVAGSDARVNEELERTLTVLEEKLFALLQLVVREEDMLTWREQAARELAPYRGKMQAAQL